ncbi:hypothetical protein AMJ82_05705 [candidate division TA06 bacterium SM23_40]|uniref:Helix-turn-helix domain-containing protein n=1 Tax=candidate division TA06 bacterium SM23_40 TaxID=1703774 RepID=A0A0S8GCN9_UNCT6|nr:MAG: hypothetical protein AMJ82_05705 [candidate division TA06 bacterium SM23_40]
MSVRKQLDRLAEHGAMVIVPVRWLLDLLDLLDGLRAGGDGEEPLADFTAEEAAVEFNRSPQTIRNWCRSGLLPGAYKLLNREWRIPRQALQALRTSHLDGDGKSVQQAGTATDLGAWRAHVE